MIIRGNFVTFIRLALAASFLPGLILSIASLPTEASAASKTVILATTTSTQDSGLLDALLPVFEKESGYVVKSIAVGSGQAMAMGRKGEADILLVHSPDAEKQFMAEGGGGRRLLVMHNDFVILGPKNDPAGIRTAKTAAAAFRKISQAGSLFVSRGDNSGTHSREKALWKAAGVNPEGGKWYQQTGLGMGQTLGVAAEKRGYLLADRGTWLTQKGVKHLEIMLEGDGGLLNVYHVIEVNRSRWPKVNAAGAAALADFLVSKRGQEIIGRFGVERFKTPLFFPDAGRNPASLGL